MHVDEDMRPRVHTDIGFEPGDAVRHRDELLAIVSHDLRNPLGAIDLAASMLQQQHHDPSTLKHLAIIRHATHRMEHLIRDLLDLSSLQSGRFSIDRKPEDLKALLTEILDSCEPVAVEKGIALVRDLCIDGVSLRVDRCRLQQVVSNLLDNAIKFCRGDDAITVHAACDDWCARIVVEDTGPGIAPSELPHVFEAYWSGKRHAKHGTGLGLYISKGIVIAHGGMIDVASAPGRATAFTITLPR